jgi:hypothetical protein
MRMTSRAISGFLLALGSLVVSCSAAPPRTATPQISKPGSPGVGVVPAEAPDTVPSWARADSSLLGPSQYISARFIRNIVVLQFRKEATQPERQQAVDLVSGKVIGGYRSTGIYLVQVADPGDGSVIVRAAERLTALPSVLAASADIELGLQ